MDLGRSRQHGPKSMLIQHPHRPQRLGRRRTPPAYRVNHGEPLGFGMTHHSIAAYTMTPAKSDSEVPNMKAT